MFTINTEALMLGGVGDSVRIYLGRKYTPLYKKGIKKDQNKSMETTAITRRVYCKFNCVAVNFDRTQHGIYLIQNFIVKQ